jgi:DnaJ homolog subfamily B member 12
MGVQKDCSENDLKKAFKKRAIKVHPDKNPYPKATDAFKKVNAAMACLSDPAKRRQYDQVGSEEAYH